MPASPSPSRSLEGQLLCSLAMVLVGSTVVVSKVIGAGAEPFFATALRHAAALPVFLVLMACMGVRLPSIGGRDAALLTVQAAAGSVGYTVLLILGVAGSSAADAGVVAGTLPAVAAAFSVVLLGERPSLRLAAAIGLATAGVMVVALSPAPGADASTRLRGILLVLGAVACEAIFILANKRLSKPIPALAMSTLMSAGGLVLSVLPAWYAASIADTVFSVPAWPALAGILYYAWVPTVGGFLLWYAGAARTSGTRAALATVWMPVSALLLSALFLQEGIRPAQWLGLGLVALAMLLAAERQRAGREG